MAGFLKCFFFFSSGITLHGDSRSVEICDLGVTKVNIAKCRSSVKYL